ncbi:hypothetical protein TGMAS_258828B, partial [Toxoplasma gondii MAS]
AFRQPAVQRRIALSSVDPK